MKRLISRIVSYLAPHKLDDVSDEIDLDESDEDRETRIRFTEVMRHVRID